MIRTRRLANAALLGLVKSRHTQFIEQLAVKMLSEDSTTENEETKSPDKAETKTQQKGANKFKFVDAMIESPSDSDLRYLKQYEKIDALRTVSWLKSEPKTLNDMNRKRLMQLMGASLLKRLNKTRNDESDARMHS